MVLDLDRLPGELKRVKAEHGWTNQVLADKAGVHRVTMQRWLQGSARPSLNRMDSLVQKLGLRRTNLRPRAKVDASRFATPIDFNGLFNVYSHLATRVGDVSTEFIQYAYTRVMLHLRDVLPPRVSALRSVFAMTETYPEFAGAIYVSTYDSPEDAAIELVDIDGHLFWNLSFGVSNKEWRKCATGRLNSTGARALVDSVVKGLER